MISGKTIERANGKTLVIIQKGDALWNIAYQRLGLGKRYLDIVELNKDKISNPDLIYPKQLFVIPNKLEN
jgi:nucleoid-associated protein YgaU